MVKFKRSKSFTKRNIREVPQDTAIVYKLKNASGKNLYTGIAGRGRGQDRLLEHKERGKVLGIFTTDCSKGSPGISGFGAPHAAGTMADHERQHRQASPRRQAIDRDGRASRRVRGI